MSDFSDGDKLERRRAGKRKIVRSRALRLDDRSMVPESAKDISPRSKRASMCAARNNPLAGSSRSLLLLSAHGLICDARSTSEIVQPVTAHAFFQRRAR